MGRHRNYGGSAAAAGPQESEEMRTATVQLTAAQILAASTTPVPVIPSPGVGKMVLIINTCFTLHAGATAFLAGGDGQLNYGPGIVSTLITVPVQATILAATDTLEQSETYASNFPPNNPTFYENKNVVWSTRGSPYTTGDGTATLAVSYVIMDTT